MKTLKEARNEIDRVDYEIVKLLKERLELSMAVRAIKMTDKTSVNDPNRESRIIAALQQELPEVHHEYLQDLYKIIFDYSKALQSK